MEPITVLGEEDSYTAHVQAEVKQVFVEMLTFGFLYTPGGTIRCINHPSKLNLLFLRKHPKLPTPPVGRQKGYLG